MPNFRFQGLDLLGCEVEWTVQASDSQAASAQMKGAGYYVTMIAAVDGAADGVEVLFIEPWDLRIGPDGMLLSERTSTRGLALAAIVTACMAATAPALVWMLLSALEWVWIGRLLATVFGLICAGQSCRFAVRAWQGPRNCRLDKRTGICDRDGLPFGRLSELSVALDRGLPLRDVPVGPGHPDEFHWRVALRSTAGEMRLGEYAHRTADELCRAIGEAAGLPIQRDSGR